MRTLAATLLVTQLLGQAVAEVAIVAPSEYENAEAPQGQPADAVGYPDGYHLQIVYDSSAFAALPASHRTMTGFYMRPDGRTGTANSVSWPNFTLKLSTTAASPASLSNEFDANVGPDETVVYDGPITFTTANAGPVGGPKEFDIAFEFETPFEYDPTDGNVLIDWTVSGRAAWVGHDEVAVSPLSSWIFNEVQDETLAADSGDSTAVFSFKFVPEPSSIALALLALAICGRRFRD